MSKKNNKKNTLPKNRIYNVDCLDGMEDIENNSVDFICCDLPYQTTKCKWDIMIPFNKLWEQYKRILKPNGTVALNSICQDCIKLGKCEDIEATEFKNKFNI